MSQIESDASRARLGKPAPLLDHQRVLIGHAIDRAQETIEAARATLLARRVARPAAKVADQPVRRLLTATDAAYPARSEVAHALSLEAYLGPLPSDDDVLADLLGGSHAPAPRVAELLASAEQVQRTAMASMVADRRAAGVVPPSIDQVFARIDARRAARQVVDDDDSPSTPGM